MIRKLEAQCDRVRTVLQVGPWYVSINHRTRKCQVTSGDMWFDISRTEVVAMIRHERQLRSAA